MFCFQNTHSKGTKLEKRGCQRCCSLHLRARSALLGPGCHLSLEFCAWVRERGWFISRFLPVAKSVPLSSVCSILLLLLVWTLPGQSFSLRSETAAENGGFWCCNGKSGLVPHSACWWIFGAGPRATRCPGHTKELCLAGAFRDLPCARGV